MKTSPETMPKALLHFIIFFLESLSKTFLRGGGGNVTTVKYINILQVDFKSSLSKQETTGSVHI